MSTIASATISAQNTWTTPVKLIGNINISVALASGAVGSLGGTTVTVQRSTDNSTWRDVDYWTSTGEDVGYEPEALWYRAGVKTGEYVNSVVLRIGREDGSIGYPP
jgi:hypothetical protein